MSLNVSSCIGYFLVTTYTYKLFFHLSIDSWGSSISSRVGNWGSSIGSWGSSIGSNWGSNSNWGNLNWFLVDVWLSWDLNMDIWFSGDLDINIWLSWDLDMDIWLSSWVEVGISYRWVISSTINSTINWGSSIGSWGSDSSSISGNWGGSVSSDSSISSITS